MKRRVSASGGIAAIIAAALIALATAIGHAQTPRSIDQKTYDDIVACLREDREVVMAPELGCAERGAGEKQAESAGMPLKEDDWDEVCKRADPRRLPHDIVKRLSKEPQIAPSGIRIFGAVFCKPLDLVGVETPFSLVLDRSVFREGVDARNAQIKGDFSFEYSLILGNHRLDRSKVGGSVYGGASFMKRLQVHDTRVEGSWQQQNSVVFLDAVVVRANMSGDFDLRKSAFSRLWIQSSQIAGTVKLDETEARCAYHVNASTVGYVTADKAGFGTLVRVAGGDGVVDYAWWNRALSEQGNPYKRTIFESASVRRLAEAELERIKDRAQAEAAQRVSNPEGADWRIPGCKEDQDSAAGDDVPGLQRYQGSGFLEFYVFETNVKSAFCLTAFAWPLPAESAADEAHPITIFSLNGTQVGGNLIIDLWNGSSSPVSGLRPTDKDYDKVAQKHKFEAVGVSAKAAIYNFSDNEKPYFTYLDGLSFDRVHKATPACANETGAKVASQVELPSVEDVLRWLNKNRSGSSQPFNAFVHAFEKAGANATELRIARKTADLCRQVGGWLDRGGPISKIAFFCPANYLSVSEDEEPAVPVQQNWFLAFVNGVADLIGTGFELLLWAVADHGFRPGKVIGPMLTVMVVFWLWFWFGLRIVGYDPADQSPAPGQKPPLPINLLFLFDRLIPLYRIREQHYAIARYYQRDTGARKPDDSRGLDHTINFLWFKIPVRPTDEAGRQRAEKWLVVLRVIGVGLTVFLLAAVSALIR